MAVIVNWDGQPTKPAPPPRTTHIASPAQAPAVAAARKSHWWIWVIVAAAPAIIAGICLWLRL